MIAALIAILSLTVIGIPITLALDRGARGPALAGLAFLYGSGAIFLVMLALSIVGIRWSLLSVTIAALLLMTSAAARLSTQHSALSTPSTSHPHWLDLITVATLIGYAFYATLAPMWEWDYWAIWGLKGRVFFENAGIDWRFLESKWNVFAHPDYPVLLPLNYDFIAIVSGAWDDRWFGLLMAAYGAAIVLIVRGVIAEETPGLFAALITAAITTAAVSRYVGLAEGPLIAFGGAAVLFIRRAMRSDDAVSWRHGAVLLGLAANVKNEGIALAVSVAIAILILKPKSISRLWPALAVAAPWLLLRATHALPTDIVEGSVLSRVFLRIRATPVIYRLLVADLVSPWVWLLLVAGIAVAFHRRREAFVFIVTAVQLVQYVGAYYATPHDPRWHIVTSWPRLTMQIALPFTVAVLAMLAVSFRRDAEARPDDR
jgi:hypothetical protein